MEYWNDARFHDYLADYLRRLLAAGLEPAGAGHALPQASQEIGRLLSFVEDSGCTFIRNGSEYPAAEAAHLQKKLDYLGAGSGRQQRGLHRARRDPEQPQRQALPGALRRADAQLRRLAEPGAAASAASP